MNLSRTFNYFVPYILQKIGYVLFFLLYHFFVHLEIKGEKLENISGPLIIAANHTSEADPTLIPLIFPFFSLLFPIYFVTNPTEKYKTFGWRSYLYGGAFFKALGGYATHSGHHDYSLSLENHEALLRSGKSLCIFPEGKRSRDGRMNPAHGGLGYLVFATGISVVPVTIDTFFNMTFADFIFRRRKVVVTIGKIMTPEEIVGTFSGTPTPENFRAWSQKVLDRIASQN